MGMQEVAIKLSMDSSSFVSSAQNVAEAFAKITEKAKEARQAGNDDLAAKFDMQALNLQSIYNGMASGNQTGGGGVAAFNNTVGGLSNTAQSLIGQLGVGDAAGGALSLAGKGAGLLGKLGTGGAIAGGGLMAAAGIGWGVKKLSDLYTTHDEAAEALNASINNTMRLRYDLTTAEGREAWAAFNKNNPDRINDFVMSSDGKTMIETLESRYKINTKNIEDAFTNASAAANSFGYSMEEGLSMVKNLTQYGFTEGSYDAARNVFGWSKMMGLSKEETADFKGMFYRYGDQKSDALGEAYRANYLMGMEKGQYGETLSILQDVFADGINKGFTKSIAEIGSTMAFLKNASNNNPLWMGEQGAARYRQLNASSHSATALSSVTDVLTYKAIASLSEAEKKNILKENGLESQGGYIDNMMIAELGFIPQIYKKKMELFEQMKGKGNKAGMIGLIKQDTGFDYVQASQFYNLMQNGKISTADYDLIAGRKIDPEYASRVAASKGAAETIRSNVAELGKLPAELSRSAASIISGKGALDFGVSTSGTVTVASVQKALDRAKREQEGLINRDGIIRDEKKWNELTNVIKDLTKQLQYINEKGLEVYK